VQLSASMDHLVAGYRAFRGGRYRDEHERYVELARSGQKPQTLVIACSDSRSDPAAIFDAKPGELFVIPTSPRSYRLWRSTAPITARVRRSRSPC